MLQIKHLTKVYKTKGGAETKALDDVSIEFGDKGLVFLLGKSGSGKSTLLNLAGGLDEPTSGEVVVMGKSSKDFSGSDFDSYRNTFVGFIFQEYNILNEFTVEDNIALALELQGKKKDKEKIYSLLKDVELEEFAKRKPNTLSGGQKQRIAIARALIKDPQIIMADEPTGALDSATGKQVFDTLKHLSETRLVIVVSHDREFAEIYGDRIVELKDGKIISDVTKVKDAPVEHTAALIEHGPDILTIRHGVPLDNATLQAVQKFIRESEGDIILTKGEKNVENFRRVNRIDKSGATEHFTETPPQNIPEQDGKKVKFIRSRLPMGKAFKMGASGLKTKPVRLIFTILLAVVAFVMFGVLSTFMLYDPAFSVSQALQQADYPSIAIAKNYKYHSQEVRINKDGTEEVTYTSDYENTESTKFGVQELKDKNAKGNGNYAGIVALQYLYSWEFSPSIGLSLMIDGYPEQVSPEGAYYVAKTVTGFTDCGETYMQSNNFSLVEGKGHYPTDKTEVALPSYLAELFVQTDRCNIDKTTDLIGKKIRFTNCNSLKDGEFTVTAIYDVGEIPSQFDDVKNGNYTSNNNQGMGSGEPTLPELLKDFLIFSYHTIVYVSEDFCDTYKFVEGNYDSGVYIPYEYRRGISVQNSSFEGKEEQIEEYYSENFYTENTPSAYKDNFAFYGLDGSPITYAAPAADEMYISLQYYLNKCSIPYNSFIWDCAYGNDTYLDEGLCEEIQTIRESDEHTFFDNMAKDLETFAAGKAFAEKYYPVIQEKVHLHSLADYLNNMLGSLDSAEQTQFETFLTLMQGEKDSGGMFSDSSTPIPDAKWDQLGRELDQIKENSKYKILFDCFDAQEMYNHSYGSNQQTDLDTAVGGNFWDFIYKIATHQFEHYNDEGMEDANVQADKEALLLQLLNENYQSVMGYERGSEDAFKFQAGDIDWNYYFKNYRNETGTLRVIGFYDLIDANLNANYLVNTSFIENYTMKDPNMGSVEEPDYYTESRKVTDYKEPADARYDFLITLTDNTQDAIAVALDTDDPSVKITIENDIYKELDMFLDMITDMQLIFLIVGLVVGVFAALMLLNFISVSISAKKQEIGILRAVGARGSDTFKIFVSEGLVISLICFVLASVASFFVCGILNGTLSGIVQMELLDFGVVNILLIFGISLIVTLIATFFPVFFAARKKPVESIRAL